MFACWVAVGLVNNAHLSTPHRPLSQPVSGLLQRSFAAGGGTLRGGSPLTRTRRRWKDLRWICSAVRGRSF